MKFKNLALMIALVHAGHAGYAQITLHEKNTPLEKLITAIERQTNYVFLYDPDEIKTITVTANVKNATLPTVLQKCLKGLAIDYIIVGKNVLLKKRNKKTF
jgi:hypothetical protein